MKKIFLFILLLSSLLILQAEEAAQETVQEEQPASETEKPVENQPAEPQNTANGSQPETAAQEETSPAEQPQAEEAKTEPQPAEQTPEDKTAAKPETEQKPAEEPAQAQTEEPASEPAACDCSHAEQQKDKKEPQGIYFQPTVGMGIGASIFSIVLNTDLDFLLKHTNDGTNIYFGFDIDFRYSPYLDDHSIYEIPVQLNLAFDFKTNHHNIDYVALWFSGGIDFAFGYLFYYDYDEDFDGKDKDKIFKVRPAWGMGVDLLFKNNLVLKLGFDGFYGKYPNLLCAAGYRF